MSTSEGRPPRSDLLVSRRQFVIGSAVIVTGLTAAEARASTSQRTVTPIGLGPDNASDITFFLARREDFLFVQADGYGLRRRGQHLVTKANVRQGTLVFTFPPQAVLEAAYPESMQEITSGQISGGSSAPPKPGSTLNGLLSGYSRVAFLIEETVAIPFTLAGLLDWYDDQMHPSVVAAAAENLSVVPQLQVPSPEQTAIELPFNLVLSPVAYPNSWSHPVDLSSGGPYELWRTRLTAPQPSGTAPSEPYGNPAGNPDVPDGGAALRAVWNYDVDPVTGKPTLPANPAKPGSPPKTDGVVPFAEAVGAAHRWDVVMATSNFDALGRADLTANRLWLSARGGFVDWEGAWDINGLSLATWNHLATLGRDHYVKIVDRGYLFPWGHRATLTEIAQREFQTTKGGTPEAPLRSHQFLTILQPEVVYTDPTVANPLHSLPFSSIKVLTAKTPFVATPNFTTPSSPTGTGAQYIYLENTTTPLRFHLVGTDWAGRAISFTAGALFLPDGISSGAVRSGYNANVDPTDPLRESDFAGATVAFAPTRSAHPGATDLHVSSISFGAAPVSGGDLDFAPSLVLSTDDPDYTNAQAIVRLAAAEQLTGGNLPGNATPAFAYHPAYVTNGFDGVVNQGEVYLTGAAVAAAGDDLGNQLADGPAATLASLIYANGSSGGLLTPNINIAGLSRALGPISDVENILNGRFNPASYFEDILSAQFLGGVTLGDVLKLENDFGGDLASLRRAHDDPSGPLAVPQISYSVQTVADKPGIEPGLPYEQLVTTIQWAPTFSDATAGSNDADYNPGNSIFTPGTSFDAQLNGVITTDLQDPTQTTYSFTGYLNDFTVTLLGISEAASLIAIHFDQLSFAKTTGTKTQVTPSGISVEFLGPLQYLNDLEQLIGSYSQFGSNNSSDASGPGSGSANTTGGANVSVTPAGVVASLAVALPPVELAIFTLSGISFAAILTLPLDGVSRTTVEFDFANAGDPFTIAGGIFGGGGYLQMVLATDGLQALSLGFDFGAMMALDIGVASGNVSLVAGFMIALTKTSGTIVGYVKLSGSLDILGIITLALEFDLQLTYVTTDNSLSGTATLSISISVFCFSVPVTMTVTKTFAGPPANSMVNSNARRPAGLVTPPPPATLADQWTDATDWQTYVNAFTPVTTSH